MKNRILGLDFGMVIKETGTDDLVPGVVESLQRINVAGIFDATYIVSRMDDEDGEQRCLKFMTERDLWSKLGIPHENIRFCRHRHEKAPICRTLGITDFVDDRIDVLVYMRTVSNLYALNPDKEQCAKWNPFLDINIGTNWEQIGSLITNLPECKIQTKIHS